MTEILIRVMNIIQRVRHMQKLNMFTIAIFAVLLAFGVMNCFFGYRLLRFWVMLFGFVIGAAGGALIVYYAGVTDKMFYLAGMVILGLLLGTIAFFSYRAGIFLLCAGSGMLLSIYILHPTSSAVFFACVLIGIGLGCLGLRYCREVIIVVTSLAGGVLTGFSGAKFLGVEEFPFGILICLGAAALGLIVQFLMNQPTYAEEEIEESRREAKQRQEEEDYFDELVYEEMEKEKQQRRMVRRNGAHVQPIEKTLKKTRRPDVAVDIKIEENKEQDTEIE